MVAPLAALFVGVVGFPLLYAAYLSVTDYKLTDRGAPTIVGADNFEARLRFGRFAGMVCSEENDYFLRAFEALGVDADTRVSVPDAAPSTGFKALMREAAATR